MDRPNSLFVSPRPQTLVSKAEPNRETNRNWGSVQRLCCSRYSAKGFLWIVSNNDNTPSMQAFPPQFRAVRSEAYGEGLIELVGVTQRVRVGLGLEPRVISCSCHVCAPSCSPSLTIIFLSWGKERSFVHWEAPVSAAKPWCWRTSLCQENRAKIPALTSAVPLPFPWWTWEGLHNNPRGKVARFAVLWNVRPLFLNPCKLLQAPSCERFN